MSIETHPYALIDPKCGKPAIFRVGVPLATDPLRAEDHEHLNGNPCDPMDPFICESCGASMAVELRFGMLIDPKLYVRRETLETNP